MIAYGGNNTRGPIEVAACLNAKASASGRQDFESETFIAHTLRAEGHDASEDGTGRGTPIVPVAFGFDPGQSSNPKTTDQLTIDGSPPLPAGQGAAGRISVAHCLSVRRLTPRACERLQGFPDDWTEGFSDSARYRMLGNAVAVPVARWIAERIAASTLAACQTHQQIHDACQTLTEDERRQLRPAVLAAAERVARLIREERKDGA